MMSTQSQAQRSPRSSLEKVLGLVTEVRPGEAGIALLMTLNVFFLLTAYYVIKPVREALILAMASGAEYKSYMSAAIAVGLLFAVPLYSRIARSSDKQRLVFRVTLFFASHLIIFYWLGSIPWVEPYLGLLFYLWVGIFNMMVVAQFWAFANDIYSEEQGKRLFPLIGLGASVGAALGSKVAALLAKPMGTLPMLLVSSGLLVGVALLFHLIGVQRRHLSARGPSEATIPVGRSATAAKKTTLSSQATVGAFGMVFRYRYLTLLAAFSWVFTLVNTNGEYLLSRLIKDAAELAVENGAAESVRSVVGSLYGDLYFYVNIGGVLLQMLVVSRLIRHAGISKAFYILPAIALLGTSAFLLFPVFAVLRVSKTFENATDYSLNNTIRNLLWLPTTQEMKYQAKQAVDTFFVRMGDVASAGVVLFVASWCGGSLRAVALFNGVLILAWLGIGRGLFREQRKLNDSKVGV